MPTVNVNGKPIEAPKGSKLEDILPIEFPCGGHGKCGKCKVKAQGSLSPISESELNLLTDKEISNGIRLACCTEVLGDCEVYTPQPEKRETAIVTAGIMPEFDLCPTFLKYGVAVDIGTTTLAARLYNRDGVLLGEATRLNPQSVWGADVISRIEAALGGKAEDIKTAVCKAVDEIIISLAENARIQSCNIDAMVITGNTAMLHLLTRTDTEPLSRAPFKAKRLFGEPCTAKALGLIAVLPETEIFLPHCMGAFIGADTVCALLATQVCDTDDTKLMVDIGTNGEICLWHQGRLYAASTAAGPAFEGVGISMGMRGEAGAIDRVYEKGSTIAIHTIGDKTPRGICGSGLVDAVATLLKLGIIDETGFLAENPVFLADNVTLSGQDIRMVQLAKSAICAGINTLLEVAGITACDIKATDIAGGFGNYLNMQNAAKIGLFPTELTDGIRVVGNAALSGASMLLLNRNFRESCAELQKRAEVTELSSSPIFFRHYMMGMMFE